MDLKGYAAKSHLELSEEEKASADNQKLVEMLSYDDEEFIYRLVGVNIHRGTGQSGHYWSLIHTSRGDKEPDPSDMEAWTDLNKNWREFNDESVSYSLSKYI